MAYKKVERQKDELTPLDVLHSEIDEQYQKIVSNDLTTGYCDSCGFFLAPSEGRIEKYNDGEQKLLCDTCHILVRENIYSHA